MDCTPGVRDRTFGVQSFLVGVMAEGGNGGPLPDYCKRLHFENHSFRLPVVSPQSIYFVPLPTASV